jgi:hypothetical protein
VALWEKRLNKLANRYQNPAYGMSGFFVVTLAIGANKEYILIAIEISRFFAAK